MSKQILKNKFFEIEYLTTSLRISGLTPTGKTNLLVDLQHLAPVPTPYGDFHFRGGHRLWHAPESMPRTYAPDTGELIITEAPNGVILETKTEPGTGIRKKIEIQLDTARPSAIIKHTLINDGLWPVELAPWAITQFRLGGTVILPMPVGNADPAGLLPNRQFSLWPYARINDPRLQWDDQFTLFKADAIMPPFKMGYFNPHGWMAYWMDGTLFRKTFNVKTEMLHPDNNCNAEIYCGDQFVELESLAPLEKLDTNTSVTHTEIWDVFTSLDSLPKEAQQLLAAS